MESLCELEKKNHEQEQNIKLFSGKDKNTESERFLWTV